MYCTFKAESAFGPCDPKRKRFRLRVTACGVYKNRAGLGRVAVIQGASVYTRLRRRQPPLRTDYVSSACSECLFRRITLGHICRLRRTTEGVTTGKTRMNLWHRSIRNLEGCLPLSHDFKHSRKESIYSDACVIIVRRHKKGGNKLGSTKVTIDKPYNMTDQ